MTRSRKAITKERTRSNERASSASGYFQLQSFSFDIKAPLSTRVPLSSPLSTPRNECPPRLPRSRPVERGACSLTGRSKHRSFYVCTLVGQVQDVEPLCTSTVSAASCHTFLSAPRAPGMTAPFPKLESGSIFDRPTEERKFWRKKTNKTRHASASTTELKHRVQ